MLYISFAPAPLSSAWMFACLLNYLPFSLSILLFMVMKSLKFTCTIFLKLHDFSVFVPLLYIILFSCIPWRDYIYYVVSCHLPDITLMSHYHQHLACYYLTLAPYYNMTYHLPPDILIPDLWLSHLREYYTCYPVLHTVTWILYLLSCIIYTVTWICSTPVHLNFWSCPVLVISRKLIITY